MSAQENVVDLARYGRLTRAEVKQHRRVKQRKLLYECYAVIIPPELAFDLGLPAAALLQQIYYWAKKKQAKKSPKPEIANIWVWDTIKEWLFDLPLWSARTTERAIKTLERENVIETRTGKVHGECVTFFRLKLDLFDTERRENLERRAVERKAKRRAAVTDRRFRGKGRTDIWTRR